MPTSASTDGGSSSADKPTLPEVIERIGFGPAHLRFCLTGGGVWFADGAEMLLITSVTKAVSDDWHLGSMARGMAVTIVFVGVLLGNIICGPLSDRYGRRQLIITSYIGIFVFSVLSSLTGGYAMFCIARLLVGFSFGIGQPAWTALSTEVTPRYWRIAMIGFSQTLWMAGEIYSCLLLLSDDPSLANLHWRRLLQLGAIPSALFAVAAFIFLLPSPSFLALHGQTEKAKSVLDIMKSDNFCDPSISTDFKVVPPPRRLSQQQFGYQLKVLFSRYYLSSTVVTGFTCFGLNMAYYGCLYAFPLILPEINKSTSSVGVQLLHGALWEIPGNAAGILIGMWLPRKPVMKIYCASMAVVLLIFVSSVRMHSVFGQILFHIGFYGTKILPGIGCITIYQYSSEIFPTEARATGTAFCIGSGRLAAMMAPLLFEGLRDFTGHFEAFFYMVATVCIFNSLLIDFLPFETAGAILTDHVVRDSSDSDGSHSESYGSTRDVRIPISDLEKLADKMDGGINPNLDDGCLPPPSTSTSGWKPW